ncbi:F-box protein 31 [Steccherinum ochraceum]|uniref:F-box protein 31 n=1 Tax=Steccherinum ochraceum TaxID=92696 RepID=A0A4R0R0X3_9APHY|nr:F-box protein 31 [Steccherinum ochraceum]
MLSQNAGSHITRLPIELLCQIFTYLPGNSVVHFLRTCRGYYVLSSSETIWQELCARHGVSSLSASGFHSQTSFRHVYAQLLHAYGPLLGLWASDSLFRGNVLQFRIVQESKQAGWEGIVGEVWRFPEQQQEGGQTLSIPHHEPTYVECLRIQLAPPKQPNLNESEGDWPPQNVSSWWLVTEPSSDPDSIWSKRQIACPSVPLWLNAPHNQSYYAYLGYPASTEELMNTSSLHPPFPPSSAVWLDTSRPTPHMRMHPVPARDHRQILRALHLPQIRQLMRFMYLAPSDDPNVPPPNARHHSLTILSPPNYADRTPYEELVNPHYADFMMFIDNPWTAAGEAQDQRWLRSTTPCHYFPLRFPSPLDQNAHAHPAEAQWDPRTVEGLWLGAYGAHGTEVLYLTYDTDKEEVHAWKITGDANVPRGVVSWRCSVPNCAADGQSGVEVTAELLDQMDIADVRMKAAVRMFDGTGTVSRPGFTCVAHIYWHRRN